MVENRPVLAVAADGNPAIAALNVLLGAVAAPGGIVQKKGDFPAHVRLDPFPASFRAVLVDSTVPWEFVPQTDAEVFRFAAWDGGGNRAGWLLPAPGFLEELTDVPSRPLPLSRRMRWPRIWSRLQRSPERRTVPGADRSHIAGGGESHPRALREIFRARQGTVYGEHPIAVTKIDSAQHFEEQLRQGAVWMGDPPPRTPSSGAN